jgi:hypothetical protein
MTGPKLARRADPSCSEVNTYKSLSDVLFKCKI